MKISVEQRYSKITFFLRSNEKNGYYIQDRYFDYNKGQPRQYDIGVWRRNTYDMNVSSGITMFVLSTEELPEPEELEALLVADSGDDYFDLLLSYSRDKMPAGFLSSQEVDGLEENEVERDWHREMAAFPFAQIPGLDK